MAKGRTGSLRAERGVRAEAARPVAPSRTGGAPTGFGLQRSIGNRAVVQLLQSDLLVTDAGHPFEHEATRAEQLVGGPSPSRGDDRAPSAQGRRHSALAAGPGSPLPAGLRRRLEPSLGGLDGVRVHRGADADALTGTLGAEAMTHGSDIFVSRAFERPGTIAGDQLLAHEAAHATGPAAASGVVHLKRVKKHLDFIKIKKKSTHITRMLTAMALSKMGMEGMAEKVDTDASGDRIDHYGHWWIEYGRLTTPGDVSTWQPSGSYGWWPSQSVNFAQTLKIDRVEGELNQGGAEDPHQGDTAETEYHPVLEVDDTEAYDSVRDRVETDLAAFAGAFTGSWNWRLGWGKNCHTFVDRAKKKLKLHHQKSKQWLSGGGIAPKAPAGPAPMDYDAIAAEWDDMLTGVGFGGLQFIKVVPFKASDLLALTTAERQALFDKLNQGVDGFNQARKPELNDALAEVLGPTLADWLV